MAGPPGDPAARGDTPLLELGCAEKEGSRRNSPGA